MKKDLFVAAIGLLIGAATLVGGEEDDWELTKRLQDLQEAASRVLMERPAPPGELPPMTGTGMELGLFPIYDLALGRPDFIPPEHRWGRHDNSENPLFGWVSEEWLQPFGTVEEIMELVRSSVEPESYERFASLNISGATLIALNSPAVLEAIGRFLDERMRASSHRCVTVEASAYDVPVQLYRQALAGASILDKGRRESFDAALDAGEARRVFGARVCGFAGQRVLLWHGEQIAVLGRPDAEVAQGVATTDPWIDVIQAGGFVSVRPSVGDDAGRVTLDLEVRYDELKEPMKTVESGQAGAIDQPRIRGAGARTSLTVPHRTWAVLGGGTPRGDRVRVLLVRATVLPRKGGVR